jgi:nudix motif 8
MQLKTVKTVRLYGREPTRKAAVPVPFCTVNSELSFLYTIRSSGLNSYRVQVSFPGGLQDKTENENMTRPSHLF